MTSPATIDVTTDDGVAPCWVHGAVPAQPRPGIILYPDAGNVRPAMHDLAAAVASWGYVVLVPNIFYRHGDYPPFTMQTAFSVASERERLMTMVRGLDLGSAMRDAGHYLRALRETAGVSGERAGCLGYCIGGRLAFTTAGAHPTLVGAAASIHGGGIANDAADSPHLQAPAITAQLYFAIADNDQSCTPAQQGLLVSALAAAHVRYTVDLFRGALHGFAVSDFPVFEQAAADTHIAQVRALFAAALS